MELDTELYTKQGIDKIKILTWIIKIVDSDENGYNENYNAFLIFMEQQLNRPMERKEKVLFLHGIADYIMTEAGTNERMRALNYLQECEYLQ